LPRFSTSTVLPMARWLQSRLSYANVTATLALIVALGGTSYAALSVGSRQIVNNSVRSADLRDNSVQGTDIRNRTLTGRDVARNRLGGAEIDESRLGPVRDALFLDGLTAAALQVGCPDATQPAGGVCVETRARASAGFGTANSQCSLVGGRLPLDVELDAAAVSSVQPEWTANILDESGGETITLLRGPGGDSSAPTGIGQRPYHCALSLKN
jgi:hypothetical protein